MKTGKALAVVFLALALIVPGVAAYAAAADDKTPRELREWTVMLYIGADNDFYDNDAGDVVKFTIEQCKKAFVDDLEEGEVVADVNLVILVDRKNSIQDGVFIYDDDDWNTQDTTWNEMNTSDPATLQAFIDHASQYYPANNYLLVTKSGHAWCGICPDVDDGDQTTEENEYWMMPIDGMRQAIADSRLGHVDMILLDGDNMASFEALYELREVVDFFVGSQQDVPIDGMPYRLMLGDLIERPSITPREFAINITERYIEYYNNTVGNKVLHDHLLANSQMAVTASAFETGPGGELVEQMVDDFMNIVSYMLYGKDYDELGEVEARTDWIPTHRPCIASARDFALIGKMADQAGYEWLPDVYSWVQMLSAYVDEDNELLFWGEGFEDPVFVELGAVFMASHEACQVHVSQCQLLNRSGNSDPHGLNIWFPPTWLHWEDLDMTRTRTYAYDGSWIELPREYYCVDCPLNYSAVELDILTDYLGPVMDETAHSELWIQFYDVYYDATWLYYSSGSGQVKPQSER